MKKLVITTKYTVQREDLVRAATILWRRTHKEAYLVGNRQVFPRLLTKKGVVALISFFGPDGLVKEFDRLAPAPEFYAWANSWVADKFFAKRG